MGRSSVCEVHIWPEELVKKTESGTQAADGPTHRPDLHTIEQATMASPRVPAMMKRAQSGQAYHLHLFEGTVLGPSCHGYGMDVNTSTWPTVARGEFVHATSPTFSININALPWSTVARGEFEHAKICLLYTSPSPRDKRQSRMPSSA